MKCYDNRFDEAALIKSLQVESPRGVNLCTDCLVYYQGDSGKSGAEGFFIGGSKGGARDVLYEFRSRDPHEYGISSTGFFLPTPIGSG